MMAVRGRGLHHLDGLGLNLASFFENRGWFTVGLVQQKRGPQDMAEPYKLQDYQEDLKFYLET